MGKERGRGRGGKGEEERERERWRGRGRWGGKRWDNAFILLQGSYDAVKAVSIYSALYFLFITLISLQDQLLHHHLPSFSVGPLHGNVPTCNSVIGNNSSYLHLLMPVVYPLIRLSIYFFFFFFFFLWFVVCCLFVTCLLLVCCWFVFVFYLLFIVYCFLFFVYCSLFVYLFVVNLFFIILQQEWNVIDLQLVCTLLTQLSQAILLVSPRRPSKIFLYLSSFHFLIFIIFIFIVSFSSATPSPFYSFSCSFSLWFNKM